MAGDELVEAPPLPDERRSALVIATASYKHHADLAGSAQDLTSMADMLGEPNLCAFEVQTLLDKTYADVWLAINRFFNNRTRDDLLLVYFSGHGVKDDRGRLHLATTDTDPDTLAATSVAARYLLDLSRESAAGRQVIIFDCCHSGAYDAKGISQVDLLGTDWHPGTEEASRGRCVISSSRAGEYAFQRRSTDGRVTGSVFTLALIEGVRTGKADAANNGRITVDDAYLYAYTAVTSNSSRQTPQLSMYGAEGNRILLARNSVGIKRDMKTIYDLINLVQSPYEPVRRGAVEAIGELIHGDNPVTAMGARRYLETLAATDTGPLARLARANLLERIQPDPLGAATGQARPVAAQRRMSAPQSRFEPRTGRPSPRPRKPLPPQPDPVEETSEPEPPKLTPDDGGHPDDFPHPFLLDEELPVDLYPAPDPLHVFDYQPAPVEEPSALVSRYLYPTEKFRGEWRRHWVDPFLAAALSGLAAGRSLLPGTARQLHLPDQIGGVPTAEAVRWCLVAVAVLAGLRALSWPTWRITLSNRQIMVLRGLLWTRTLAIPLVQIVNVNLTQSPLAKALRYGTLSLQTGRWRWVRIRHLPFPNELWLRITEERFEPAAVEARLSRSAEEYLA